MYYLPVDITASGVLLCCGVVELSGVVMLIVSDLALGLVFSFETKT